jgi:hypothetical protein
MNLEEWKNYIRAAPDADFAAPEGKTTAVVYSGFDDLNRQFAQQDCKVNSAGYTIEDTAIGKRLEQADLFHDKELTRSEAYEVWRVASEQFSKNAKGDIETHVIDARPDSIFRETELPALLENQNVTSINGISRQELKALYDTGPEGQREAYDKICAAELARDQQRLASVGNQELEIRTEWKEFALDAQRHAWESGDARISSTPQEIPQWKQEMLAEAKQNTPPPPSPPPQPDQTETRTR